MEAEVGQFSLTSTYRCVCFTLNNYTEEEYESICLWKKPTYLVVGKEIAPTTGTPHLQGYVEFDNSVKGKYLKKFNSRISWRRRYKDSNAKACRTYCIKDGIFFEKGEISKQGERSDLHSTRDAIANNETTVEQIVMENPYLFHQYGRTLQKLEDIANRKKYRTWQTKGIWYHGETGVGKSHKAFENYDPTTHYVLQNDNGWWDGYTGQKVVIMNEFRGQIPFEELLQLTDKWPHAVKRRAREPMPFLAETIIVTSPMTPQQLYGNFHSKDSIKQLLRRFEVFFLESVGSRSDQSNTNADHFSAGKQELTTIDSINQL